MYEIMDRYRRDKGKEWIFNYAYSLTNSPFYVLSDIFYMGL